MAKLIVEEQKEFSLLPVDSILLLKVDELAEKEVDGRNGKWTKLEVKFKILGIQVIGDGSPVEQYEDLIAGPIWGSVPMRLTDSPENKLRQWAEAILGIDLGIGFELDTDHFMARECRGITSQYDKRAINPATGQPFKQHQVESLLRKGPVTQQPNSFGQPSFGQPSFAQQPTPVADPWAAQQPQQPAYAQPQGQPDPWGGTPVEEPPF